MTRSYERDVHDPLRAANRLGVHVWCDVHETTAPGDVWRTYRPGARHAAVVVPVPVWAAGVFVRCRAWWWRWRARARPESPAHDGAQ